MNKKKFETSEYPEVRGNLYTAKTLVKRRITSGNYRLGANGECLLEMLPDHMIDNLFISNNMITPSGIYRESYNGSRTMIYKLK